MSRFAEGDSIRARDGSGAPANLYGQVGTATLVSPPLTDPVVDIAKSMKFVFAGDIGSKVEQQYVVRFPDGQDCPLFERDIEPA